MMRGAGGALAVAVAALIVCCNADAHQESDVSGAGGHPGERFDPGHDQSQDHPGDSLVRTARDIRHAYAPFLMSRRYDYASPLGKRERWPAAPARVGGYYPERNFDEIDRSGLDQFVIKRNFDEIDQTSMPFPYAIKRFYHGYGPNHLDMDTPVSSFDKRIPHGGMDEIDFSMFPIGSKRSQDGFRPQR